jgi:hypothetical protein
MSDIIESEIGLYSALSATPQVDLNKNVQAALATGRSAIGLAADVLKLTRGPGKLHPREYFYYSLWNRGLNIADKLAFVGKRAQHMMHVACNDRHWYQTAADKILFHTIMAGAGLPVPSVLALTQTGRVLKGSSTVDDPALIAAFLRDESIYPLFAKPAAGKYSLNVISADRFVRTSDSIRLLGGDFARVEKVADQLLGGHGYVLQPRLNPDPRLAVRFGPRLWSVRLLVFIRPTGPFIHRALVKIATGQNPADNYWRTGNMLAALNRETGEILTTAHGTGVDLTYGRPHPDTGASLVGTAIPGWNKVCELTREAASLFPGIRTQSWDIALSDCGPVCLEVNFGGDLNLAQLAEGRGVLDEYYRAHLKECGYRF